jgi:hypothetical protein
MFVEIEYKGSLFVIVLENNECLLFQEKDSSRIPIRWHDPSVPVDYIVGELVSSIAVLKSLNDLRKEVVKKDVV